MVLLNKTVKKQCIMNIRANVFTHKNKGLMIIFTHYCVI